MCRFCVVDPGSLLADLDSRPEADNRLLADAADLRTVAVELRRAARSALKESDAKAACDYFAEHRKSLLDAAKLEAPVLRRDHTRWLVEERRRMHGGATAGGRAN